MTPPTHTTASGTGTAADLGPAAEDPREFWQIAYDQREQGRRSGTGFFAVTGLYWLSEIPAVIPGIPGRWSVEDDQVTAQLGQGHHLEQDGEQLTGSHTFAPIAERGGLQLTVPDGESDQHSITSLEIARRGGRYILRPRSATHPFLSSYEGTARFEYDPSWRLSAEYEPFAAPRPVTVGAAVEGIEHIYHAPGSIHVEVAGVRHTLVVFDGFAERERLLLFTDETSGETTYPSVRSLRVAVDDSGNHATSVIVDFNNASNLPCAYTDLATCPLPPAGNRVAAAVTAGERKPSQRVQARPEGPGVTWDQVVRP